MGQAKLPVGASESCLSRAVLGLGHDEKPTESSALTSIAIKDVRLEEKHFRNMSDNIDLAEVVPPELGRSASDTESMTVG
jgi:hypothetical protein